MSEDADENEMRIKSVFHSVDSVLHCLKSEQVNGLYEVKVLLNSFNDSFPDGFESFPKTPRKELFVVFEGLDGSGKSTIARLVARALQGFQKATPPACVSKIRKLFDQRSPEVRKAFYSLSNYIAAKEIQVLCQTTPVFMDRFWHSTAAYAIAQEFEGRTEKDMPPIGNLLYKWPEDLIKPDLVLFLDVDEETRRIRHGRRHKTTKEENQLTTDEAFRNLVLAAYSRMTDVPVSHVDSTLSVKNTVRECISRIGLLTRRDGTQYS